jgi:hypothetical protein
MREFNPLKPIQIILYQTITSGLQQHHLSPNNVIMMVGLASQFEGILATKKEG